MDDRNDNSAETLRDSILADARAAADQIVARARQEAQDLLDQARAQADAARRKRVEAAQAEAARRGDLLLARVPVEIGRRRSTRAESLLQSVHDDARARLLARDGFDYRDALVALAADAIGRMAGDAFVAGLSPDDYRRHADGIADDIVRAAGRPSARLTIVEDPAITDGGVVLRDGQGYQAWDNRLLARLERLWPDLRLQVAIQAGLAPKSDAQGADQ